MRTCTLFTAVTGLALAGALALTGCASAADPGPKPVTTERGADEASAFLACLTKAGVVAKINDSGQVLVKDIEQSGDGGAISSESGSGGDGLLGMEGDDAGNTWVIAADATYFQDDPTTQDAYAACEDSHPDFSQPEADPAAGDPEFAADQKKQEEAAIGFAQCARKNGYSQVEDPDFSAANALTLPASMTEAEFRTLIEECWNREGPVFNFGQSLDASFDAWAVLDEFLNTAAS